MRRYRAIAWLIAVVGCAASGTTPFSPDALIVEGLGYSTTMLPSADGNSLVVEMTIRNPGVGDRFIEVIEGAPLSVQFRRRTDDSVFATSPAGSSRVAERVRVPARGVKRLTHVVTPAELAAAPGGVYLVSARLTTPSTGPSVVQSNLVSLPLTVLR